jgi:hypothetical protein
MERSEIRDAAEETQPGLRFAPSGLRRYIDDGVVVFHLAPLAGRGGIASSDAIRVRGTIGESERVDGESERADRAPHPNPLRASFARLDPAKSGAREQTAILP